MDIRFVSLTLAALLGAAQVVYAADPNTLTAEQQAAGWQLLFDGQTLDGWKVSDKPGTFSVKNGEIVVHGPRSHLFYLGDVLHHDFHNFELELEVMTFPKANSGVYFHTQWQDSDWPSKGREVQINNSHSDPSRTGGIYAVQTNMIAPAKDKAWFTLNIRVDGNRVITAVDGKRIVDYVEDDRPSRESGAEERPLRSGTFALQGHDPESEVHYRTIKVRALP